MSATLLHFPPLCLCDSRRSWARPPPSGSGIRRARCRRVRAKKRAPTRRSMLLKGQAVRSVVFLPAIPAIVHAIHEGRGRSARLGGCGSVSSGTVPRPRVGVTARITPPSITTKPMTPTTTKLVETPDDQAARGRPEPGSCRRRCCDSSSVRPSVGALTTSASFRMRWRSISSSRRCSCSESGMHPPLHTQTRRFYACLGSLG